MRQRSRFPGTSIWCLLAGATLTSYFLAESALPARLAATAVVLIALFKIRLVFIHFMELSARVQPLRAMFELWGVIVTLIILGGYWLAAAV